MDLWLVTDILYAEKFRVDATTSSSGSAGVSVPGALIGAPVPSVGSNVQTEGSAGTAKELTGGNIPFAIRAMRLRYKANGTLYRVDADGGKQAIIRKMPQPPVRDPVRDPSYNMGDLFSNEPVNQDDEPNAYVPFEIIVDNHPKPPGTVKGTCSPVAIGTTGVARVDY